MHALRTASACCLVALALGGMPTVRAERLPVRVYTTADGLPRDQVRRIVLDRDGFVWLLTGEGAARFDGERIRTFTAADGFPPGAVNDLLETADRTLWLATDRGLFRLPRGGSLQPVSVTGAPDRQRVVMVYASPTGRLWAGAESAVVRLDPDGDRWHTTREQPGPLDRGGSLSLRDLAEDGAGCLWAATAHGLFRRDREGTWTRRLPDDVDVRAVAPGADGQVIVATLTAVLAIAPESGRTTTILTAGALGIGLLRDVLVASDGSLWIAGCSGIAHLAAAETAPRTFWTAEGWPDTITVRLAEDGARNIWAATESGGAVRIVPGGFTSFDERDGLPLPRVSALLDDADGALLAVVGLRHDRRIVRFDGRRFTPVPLRLPGALADLGWGTQQVLAIDGHGEWWLATAHGLARWIGMPTPSRPPDVVYTAANGLPADEVFRVYEDRAGNVWVSTITLGEKTLSRFDRARGTFRVFGASDGAPASAPSAFGEDAAGRLWIGFYDGGLARVSGDRLQYFAPGTGGPRGFVWDIHLDAAGRVWVGSSDDGLQRIDDPASDPPRMTSWSRATGLSSDTVQGIVDDGAGHVFAGTPRGIDRIDVDSGEITHYTTADGIASCELMAAHRSRSGALWFGTLRGLSRLAPHPASAVDPPHVHIEGVRIAGRPVAVDPLGQREVGEFTVEPGEHQIDLDFGGLQLGGGGPLRFQYLVEGSGVDWSRATRERSMHFANLGPGRYRVLVRAVGPGGVTSPRPAVVAFRVLRPLWQRWYTLALAALALGAALVSVHRLRTARLVELERVRTRIAADLHDDIGATLSEIAIAAEVARRQVPPTDGTLGSLLEHIAGDAREMVDAMSDIVWSIDPRRDRVGDLVGRVRRFGGDLFGARGMEFVFRAPEALDHVALDTNRRRELLLILKEALNNAARHARATRVEAGLDIEAGELVVVVADDGCGFDADAAHAGQGVPSLRRRAVHAGGACTIESSAGSGTRIEVRIPIGG